MIFLKIVSMVSSRKWKMGLLDTEIVIDSSLEEVWTALKDFSSYPSWNPFIRSIEGNVSPGEEIMVTMQQPGGKPTAFKPTVLKYEPLKQISWRGKIPVGSGACCPAPSGQNGSYRPGKPLLDQQVNVNSRLRLV